LHSKSFQRSTQHSKNHHSFDILTFSFEFHRCYQLPKTLHLETCITTCIKMWWTILSYIYLSEMRH
jgi:hypothetical protein